MIAKVLHEKRPNLELNLHLHLIQSVNSIHLQFLELPVIVQSRPMWPDGPRRKSL